MPTHVMPNGYARFNEKKQITVKISTETCHLELVKGMKVI